MTKPRIQSQTVKASVDPTTGLVEYVQTIKPYHTKILEVLVEYVYGDTVSVTTREKSELEITMSQADADVVHSCGYGLVWDTSHMTDATPIANIISTQSPNDAGGVPLVNPFSYPVNSFLVGPTPGSQFDVIVSSVRSNQLVFVRRTNIVGVTPSLNRVIVQGDIRPVLNVVGIVYDNPPSTAAGTCSFVISGNVVQYFQPGSGFTVSGTANAGTYSITSGTSTRQLTSFDGTNTIVPVNESIASPYAAGGIVVVDFPYFLPEGSDVYINGNTRSDTDRKYTVATVILNAGNTVITTHEPISILATVSGFLCIPLNPNNVPMWAQGLEVLCSSIGTLPTPLQNMTSRYYYIPTPIPGVFNLSHTRYPSKYGDIINLEDIGQGAINIRRAETFFPGASVKVLNSYGSNDGNYTVHQSVQEGVNTRVYVLESLVQTSTIAAGTMQINIDAYDSIHYCALVQAPDLYADTYISERIQFEFDVL